MNRGYFSLTAYIISASIILYGAFGVSPVASAHPGRTASDGCHYCRTNCDSWGVEWDVRHCHNGYSQSSYYSEGDYYGQSSYYNEGSYYSEGDYYGEASYYSEAEYYGEGSYYSEADYYEQGIYYSESTYETIGTQPLVDLTESDTSEPITDEAPARISFFSFVLRFFGF